MDLNERIESIRKYKLNCNVFSVYDYDDVTLQELLNKFFTRINDCINVSNSTLDLAEWLVNEGLHIEVVKQLEIWLQDGTLQEIINEKLFKEINEKIEINTSNIIDLNDRVTKNENDIIDINHDLGIVKLDVKSNKDEIDLINKILSEGIKCELPTYEIEEPSNKSIQFYIDDMVKSIKENDALNRLKIGSFNIYGSRHRNLKTISDTTMLCIKEKLNVIGIQEFVNYFDFNTEWWLKMPGAYDYTYQRTLMWLNGGEGGNGLMSHNTMTQTNTGLFSTVSGKEQRGWTGCDINVNGKKVRIYNTHLTHDNMDMLHTEMGELAEIVKNDTTKYKFITGDFNTRDLIDYKPFTDLGYKFSLDLSTRTIDNVLYHPTTARVIQSKIVPTEDYISDHDLIWSEMELI